MVLALAFLAADGRRERTRGAVPALLAASASQSYARTRNGTQGGARQPRGRHHAQPSHPAPRIMQAHMRVISGTYRGRELVAPKGLQTRPTSDRVREALFSILGDVTGLRVLDLFAGSGALAIEALSRGAASATLVDSAQPAVAAIRRNLGALGIEAEVVARPASRFLLSARTHARQYDLVFIDPPYRRASTLGRELSTSLAPVLSAEARVVAESDRRSPLDLRLALLDERRYGDTLIQIHGSR
jgi:16S rRNA (guanine966-N2)-methyltransferase